MMLSIDTLPNITACNVNRLQSVTISVYILLPAQIRQARVALLYLDYAWVCH